MIHFTKHALEKFAILKKHGFIVDRNFVAKTVIEPDMIDYSRSPLKIAQRILDRNHVLRVVYKIDSNVIVVITFYPGRKSQYENEK